MLGKLAGSCRQHICRYLPNRNQKNTPSHVAKRCFPRIGLPLAYLIIMYFYQIGGAQDAVIGGIIGSLVATLPQVVWALIWSWKNYDAKADFGSSAKILAASLLAAAVTYIFVSLLDCLIFYAYSWLCSFRIDFPSQCPSNRCRQPKRPG